MAAKAHNSRYPDIIGNLCTCLPNWWLLTQQGKSIALCIWNKVIDTRFVLKSETRNVGCCRAVSKECCQRFLPLERRMSPRHLQSPTFLRGSVCLWFKSSWLQSFEVAAVLNLLLILLSACIKTVHLVSMAEETQQEVTQHILTINVTPCVSSSFL